MRQTEGKTRHQRERSFYEPIKAKLEALIRTRHANFHLEITADKRFTNKLKAEISPHGHRDIIFNFLREAAPDITGFIKEQYSSAFIVVEVKNDEIKIDDVYQAKRYAELFDAKYPFLISTEEIPEEIKRLSKVVYKVLSGGYGSEKIILVQYDPEKNDFVEWFEKNPFEK